MHCCSLAKTRLSMAGSNCNFMFAYLLTVLSKFPIDHTLQKDFENREIFDEVMTKTGGGAYFFLTV